MSNRIHDAFEKIHADKEMKSNLKDFIRENRMSQSSSIPAKKSCFKQSWFPKVTTAMVAICCLVVGINGHTYLSTPVSYISIDVNPSIELSLNALDRVVEATAYNDDGSEVLDATVSVKGNKYESAIDIILSNDVMSSYLTPEADLTLTVAAKESEKEEAILNCISEMDICKRKVAIKESVSLDLVEEAHSNEFSFGKYNAYKTLVEHDSTVGIDQCRSMTMQEIHQRITDCLNGNIQHTEDNEHVQSRTHNVRDNRHNNNNPQSERNWQTPHQNNDNPHSENSWQSQQQDNGSHHLENSWQTQQQSTQNNNAQNNSNQHFDNNWHSDN